MSKFPCSLARNMTSHSMENLTFHSLLRWKVIILQILTTSLIQSLFERLGEYTFELRSERVNRTLPINHNGNTEPCGNFAIVLRYVLGNTSAHCRGKSLFKSQKRVYVDVRCTEWCPGAGDKTGGLAANHRARFAKISNRIKWRSENKWMDEWMDGWRMNKINTCTLPSWFVC